MRDLRQHLFFDLDHTLWDFETNSRITLSELFEHYRLTQMGIPDSGEFIERYIHINKELWDLYRQKLVSKNTLRTERFRKTFETYGIPFREMPLGMAEDYIQLCPEKGNLMPYAREILDYLSEKYRLHIITNGFRETQMRKLKQSQIEHYFEVVLCSEDVQAHKPDLKIFKEASERSGAKLSESYYIGDHLEADIQGSRNAGMKAIFYNPEGYTHDTATDHEIRHFIELEKIF